MKVLKIQLASDLHLEFLAQQHPNYKVIEPADADLLVLAGDIHNRTRAISVFKNWPVPVVYVCGNHEYYGQNADKLIVRLRAAAAGTRVHFLENEEFHFAGVRFLGCSLWTDYKLHGASTVSAAMQDAQTSLPDHDIIRTTEGKFTPAHALALHEASRAWLEQKLDEVHDGPTVVVTHFAPHSASIHPWYLGNALNPASISDLTPLMGKAQLWLHGHVHTSCRYDVIGPNGLATTVVANPAGYPENRRFRDPNNISLQNEFFNRRLVVEISWS